MKKFESYLSREDYEIDKALSYSLLKDIDSDPEVLAKEFIRKDTKALKMGSLIDTILFEPEKINEFFYITDIVKPSENISKIIQKLIDDYGITEVLNDKNHRNVILKVAEAIQYGQSYKEDTLITKILKDGQDYHQQLVELNNKQLVSNEEYSQAAEAVSILLKNPWSRKWLVAEQPEIEILYHFRINYKLHGVACKSELDVVHIDHKKRYITPLDVKTGEQSFMKSFYQFKWYLQAALYSEGLENFCTGLPDYEGYIIKPFKFIHVNLKYMKYPVIYSFPITFLIHALTGWESITGIEYKGIYPLIDEAIFHLNRLEEDPNAVLYPMDLLLNDGKREIPVPSITLF